MLRGIRGLTYEKTIDFPLFLGVFQPLQWVISDFSESFSHPSNYFICVGYYFSTYYIFFHMMWIKMFSY
jgi:hypothetical protein